MKQPLTEFQVHRVGFVNQFLKSKNASGQVLTGNKEFDKQFYIVCDTLELQEKFKNAEVQETIEAIFNNSPVRAIGGDSRKIDLNKYKKDKKPSGTDFLGDAVFNEAGSLKKLKTLLELPPGNYHNAFKNSPFYVSLINCLLVLLICAAGWQGASMLTNSILYAAIIPGLILAIFWILLSVKYLKDSTKFDGIMPWTVITGVPGGIGIGVIILSLINTNFDTSTPHIIETQVTQKYLTSGRYGSVQHHIMIADWEHQGEERELLGFDGRNYSKVEPGMRVKVVVRDGYLNAPWIEHETLE